MGRITYASKQEGRDENLTKEHGNDSHWEAKEETQESAVDPTRHYRHRGGSNVRTTGRQENRCSHDEHRKTDAVSNERPWAHFYPHRQPVSQYAAVLSPRAVALFDRFRVLMNIVFTLPFAVFLLRHGTHLGVQQASSRSRSSVHVILYETAVAPPLD